MLRHLLAIAALAAAIAAPLLGACDVTLTETCVDGPCSLPSSGSVGASSSSSSGAGGSTTVDGGGGGAPLDAKNCPTIPKTGDFPCDVFAVIHSVCNKCHNNPQKNGAPFQILTYADTQLPYLTLLEGTCTKDADCGPTPGNCNVATGICKGLRFQQMFISTGPDGCPQMPFGEGMLPEPEYSTLHDWLGKCAPPVPAGTGCGCPGNGCN